MALVAGKNSSNPNDLEAAYVTNHALHTTLSGVPSAQFTPTDAGTPLAELTLDAGTGNEIVGLRATVNPGDSIVAATRLQNGYPDTALMNVGDSVRITSSSPITNISLVGVGSATNTAGNVITENSPALADVQAAMKELLFNSSDNVTTVEITLTDKWASGQKARFQIAGYAS